jgi:competence protein ComEC
LSPFDKARGLVAGRPWHLAAGSLAFGLALAEAPEAGGLACAALLFAAVAACGASAAGALAAALVLAGAALGQARLEAIDGPAERIGRATRAVDLRAHVLTLPRPGAFGASAEVEVAGGPLAGARLLARIPRWAEEGLPEHVVLGEGLRLRGRLQRLRPEHDGYHAHLRRRGVTAELLVDAVTASGERRGGVEGALDRMRERAGRAVAAGMPGEEATLARGMVLGEDEAIPEGIRQDFRDSGLAHLLAVSGQNVMLLVALALPLLALLGLGPRARGVALIPLVAFYVPLAGAGPSLQRAGVMGVAGIAALTLSRPASRWYALLLAAAVTLALNPRSYADPGWQLSFAAVAGILIAGVPLRRALTGAAARLTRRPGRMQAALTRGLADGLAITASATVATAPLLAHHFGSVSAASLPANLLALPAVAPAMWLGMVKAALGVLEPALPVAAALAEALGPLAALPVRMLAWLAGRFADVPLAAVGLPLGSRTSVVVAYALLGAAGWGVAVVARRAAASFEERAARWRRLPSGPRRAVAAALAAAALLAAVRVLAPPAPPDRLTVSFLDVGQGDATLIQHPDGGAILFDGGPPEGQVARLLRRAGVRRLSIVVATHASRDHHGGLADVLERFRVETLLDGGDGNPDPGLAALRDAARSHGVRVVRALAPANIEAGGLRIRILSPAPRPSGPAPEDPNPRAVVAVVRAGDFDLLLSADAESGSLLPLDLPDVDAMKVPHHGSADPGLPAVLRRLRPEVAAIEVGQNTYGHPAPPTLAALARSGARLYRTDRQGTITLTVRDGDVHVETER